MLFRQVYLLVLMVFGLMGLSMAASAQKQGQEKVRSLAMRMIGHEMLLQIGDSSSRILPISKEGLHYRISFDTTFAFQPESLVEITEKVFNETQVVEDYLVEVINCADEQVVYSYQIKESDQTDFVPCKSRMQPRGCYEIVITMLDEEPPFYTIESQLDHKAKNTEKPEESESSALLSWWLLPVILLLFGGSYWVWNNRAPLPDNTHILSLGAYRFDTRNLELHYQEQRTELTSKEADLLQLLYDSANATLERGVILKEVWGDEGDYIGRTLDVFISKLRKKLENDDRLRIVNVRGVGYKLVVNDANSLS